MNFILKTQLNKKSINRRGEYKSFNSSRLNMSLWNEQLTLIKNTNTPQEELWKLAAQENLPPEVREELLKKNDWIINKLLNPELGDFITMTMSGKTKKLSEEELITLARDPFLHSFTAKKLAQCEHHYVRHELAGNKSLTPEIQILLAEDYYVSVRYNLAQNKSITPHVQEILARDKDDDVRTSLASNPSLTPEVINLLSQDKNKNVRRVLALNHGSFPYP